MIEYYSKRALEYDKIYHKPERQSELAKLKAAVADKFEDADVLELACGTGYWTQVISPRIKSVLALDINEEVLQVARTRDYQSASVQFEIGDVYDLSPVEGVFNAGLAGFLWSHIPKKKLPAFLDAFCAKLLPGSRVVFIDNVYVEGSSTPIVEQDEEGNTYQLRRLENGSEYKVMKNFPTAQELREVVGDAVAEFKVETFTYYWCMSFRVLG